MKFTRHSHLQSLLSPPRLSDSWRKAGLLTVTGLLIAGLCGCEEAQYDAAVENYGDEVIESRRTIQAATEDGELSAEEEAAIDAQRSETREAAAEILKQKGDIVRPDAPG